VCDFQDGATAIYQMWMIIKVEEEKQRGYVE
jgi:hypothetical protein